DVAGNRSWLLRIGVTIVAKPSALATAPHHQLVTANAPRADGVARHRVEDGAAGLLGEVAIAKPACAEKGSEFDETLGDGAAVQVAEAEFPNAGGVHQLPAPGKTIEGGGGGGVAALGHLRREFADQGLRLGVEQVDEG